MDFTIEEYNEVIHLTIIEETDTLEFSIEEIVEEVNLTIEEYHGVDGAKGEKPNHQWNGTSLRFENPDDTWGNYVDLKGDKGDYGGGLMSVVAGDNITIDNTDPLNPIINAENGGTTVTKTSDLINDGSDGLNPYISLNDIPEVDISTKAEVDASNLSAPNVISWRDALDIYNKREVDDKLELKLDKPTTDGSWVVTKSGSTITYTDASTFGQNISNSNLTWSADRTQNLNAKKLSFTGGRVSVPALEYEVTTSNSLPNKTWTDGVDLWFTNNLGINSNISAKLDKITAPNNISSRVVNADNSTSDKGEFQQSEQIEINTNTTAQASWRGKEVWITGNCTITIPAPSTLPPFWSVDVFILSGTLTHAITSPATWIGTAPTNAIAGSYYRIVRRGNTNTFKVLGLWV